MRRIPAIILVLSWGLWFGGLIVLFIAVSSLFQTLHERRDLAGTAAAQIFKLVNRYQIVLAAITLLSAFGCRPPGGSRITTAFLALLAAAVVSLVVVVWLAFKIELIHLNGDVHSPEFARLHGLSMGLSALECLFLLLAGVLLPMVIVPPPHATEPKVPRPVSKGSFM
jgi:hypothetical protein